VSGSYWDGTGYQLLVIAWRRFHSLAAGVWGIANQETNPKHEIPNPKKDSQNQEPRT
jgi:hypothetical protein